MLFLKPASALNLSNSESDTPSTLILDRNIPGNLDSSVSFFLEFLEMAIWSVEETVLLWPQLKISDLLLNASSYESNEVPMQSLVKRIRKLHSDV